MKLQYKPSKNKPYFGEFWPQGVPKTYEYDTDLSLREFFNRSTEKYAEHTALWCMGWKITYFELKILVDKLMHYFTEIGVKKGDVVAVHLPNCMQFIISYYAITSLGAIVSGINPTYKSIEIFNQIKLVGAKYLIVLDNLYAQYEQALFRNWSFQKIIIASLEEQQFLSQIAHDLNIPQTILNNTTSQDIFLECIQKRKFDDSNTTFSPIQAISDTAVLIMTGGTTGIPKAAELSHMNVIANAQQWATFIINQKENSQSENLGINTGFFGILPLYHSFAMTTIQNVALQIGGWILLFPKPPAPDKFLEFLSSLPKGNGFVYCGAEILFQRIAELDDSIIKKFPINGKLKLCVSGASSLHEYVRIPFEKKTGAKITEGYGLSEASPVVSANNIYGYRESGFIGVPIPGTEWAIFNSEDFSKGPFNEFGSNVIGEICVKGPQVMKGYFNEPERTAATIREYNGERWLLTGDIGFMDQHGRIQICDRKKSLIKMAGRSIFPKDIESLIGNHPGIREVAVAGLPDERTGEAVKAWVSLKQDYIGKLTIDEILIWCKRKMAPWKVPKYLEIIKEIPKTPVGKILRRQLQESDPIWIEAMN